MPDIPANPSTTASVIVGGTATGDLETAGDHDWFAITLTAGQAVTITVNGITLDDPYLYIRDSAGVLLFENDDISSGVNLDSRFAFNPGYSGTYYIDVHASKLGYRPSDRNALVALVDGVSIADAIVD